MDIHRFGFLWKGEFGRLVLIAVVFALVIGGIVYWKNLHPGAPAKPTHGQAPNAEASRSTVTTFDNNIPIFHAAPPTPTQSPVVATVKPAPKAQTPLMAFSFSDTPRVGEAYAAYGRFLRCKLVITVDSNRIQTPIVGIVLEDVYSVDHQLIIPALAEVHGMAQSDSAEERIGSQNQWVIVWRTKDNREVELPLTGIALDHAPSPQGSGWGLTDGSAGLRGQVIRSDNLSEIKMLLAQFGAGFAQSFAQSGLQSIITANGSVLTSQNNGFQQAGAQGVQNAATTYAQQIADTVKREGIFIRVPDGTDFYLYVTQTLDASQARVGATMAARGSEATLSKLNPASP
jgi:hypothetical protein